MEWQRKRVYVSTVERESDDNDAMVLDSPDDIRDGACGNVQGGSCAAGHVFDRQPGRLQVCDGDHRYRDGREAAGRSGDGDVVRDVRNSACATSMADERTAQRPK